MDIRTFCMHCDDMRDIWIKSRKEDIPLHPYPVRVGNLGIKSLFNLHDYSIVRIEPDEFDEGVVAGEFILPYSGSIMYGLKAAN